MNSSLTSTDTDLWNAFRQGDDGAYESIYREFSPVLYSYGYQLCRDSSQTEDCMHDLFVYLYQHRNTLNETNSIKYYLYRCLRRRISEKAQAASRWVSDEDPLTAEKFEPTTPPEIDFMQEQTACEVKQKLDYLLGKLPKRQREALHLLYFQELSYPEIAQIMGLEVKSVYNLTYNSLTSLRDHIRQSNLQFFDFALVVFFGLLLH
ncbi:RNA polymerase sigma factor [Fibrella aquatilis]|uniref:Sigma-70 family RNA polymerase sigma factor n=1 Tax=Fibrella aquatilis TaxID=2817059 RepID=A0A939G6H3_9BACT|nr:sigma-70 family RNA polymerase sigma factor [Fibrella aquatilis]MBO0931925.1 sigma-70 family RNA polymerase sigma factor [Fibrella aquatilis]